MAGGSPLEKALEWLPKSKIRYNAAALDPILASAEFGYRYFPAKSWLDLSKDEQATLLAAYRVKHGMAAYQAHEKR